MCVGRCTKDPPWLPAVLASAAHAAVIELGIGLNEVFRLTGPAVYRAPAQTKFTSPPFNVLIHEDPKSLKGFLQAAADRSLARFMDGSWSSNVRGRVFPIAAQRFIRAQAEVDPCNCFLEYWFTCEFLSSRMKKRTVDMNIKEMLAECVGWRSETKKHLVYVGCRIEQLKNVRDGIAHGRLNAVRFEDQEMIKSIAGTLIRYELGHPYAGNELIDKSLVCASEKRQLDRRKRNRLAAP
jgi:hypothetical protein